MMIKKFGVLSLIIPVLLLSACAGTATKESTGEYVDDTVITSKVKVALLKEKSISAGDINVETFKGVVQLSGFVSSNEQARRAVEVTRSIDGVRYVENDMKITRKTGTN